MNGVGFLQEFPMTEQNFATGGGCTAWKITLPGGSYILITNCDANAPMEYDAEVVVGSYGEDHESLDDPTIFTWDEAAEFVRETLAQDPIH